MFNRGYQSQFLTGTVVGDPRRALSRPRGDPGAVFASKGNIWEI